MMNETSVKENAIKTLAKSTGQRTDLSWYEQTKEDKIGRREVF